ncbi:MAG TPA: DUF4833 domain-containing protein [Polyangiaceae bacterium]|nr:DUF4833 domain-containing protein [Polyangiaceae bacterium]
MVPRRLPLSPSFFLTLLALAALALVASIALGGADRDGRVIRSVFFIAKSENKNEVHYGIRLDEACRPAGDAPVFAYWRMFERGPLETEPLLAREEPAYGVSDQRALKRNEQGGSVFLTLNALPKRPIIIDSTTSGATCTATAKATIGGVPASLVSVFVQLRWPFGVDYLLLSGSASLDGRAVRERVSN